MKLAASKIASADLATLEEALLDTANAAIAAKIQARIDELEAEDEEEVVVDKPVEVKLPKVVKQTSDGMPAQSRELGLCEVTQSLFQGVVEGEYGPQWLWRIEVITATSESGWLSMWLPEGKTPGTNVMLTHGKEANPANGKRPATYWPKVGKTSIKTDDKSAAAAARIAKVSINRDNAITAQLRRQAAENATVVEDELD